ncbi:hypothetical protein ACOMHN_001605 [Nucella lapillus]
MTSLWALALFVTCAHYVTAQDFQGPCPSEHKINSTSVSCEDEKGCDSSLICCPYKGGKKCAEPVISNYRATMYILGLPRVADENRHLTNYINKTFRNASTLKDLVIERLGPCIELYITLHTEQEAEVDTILADMETSPVSIDHFSEGGPFTVSSAKNDSVCKEVEVIPNFRAVLYVVGVPKSVTPEMIKTKMMGELEGVGHSWSLENRTIGGCLEVYLNGVLSLKEEDEAIEVLARLEEEGLTMREDGSYLRVVSTKEDSAVCPDLKVNDTMPIAIPNYQIQLYILNVVGVVTFDQVKDELLETVRPFGFRWQILNLTKRSCMDVFLEGEVKEEEETEDALAIALMDLEMHGLNVTSANRVFNVTSRKDQMEAMCEEIAKPTVNNETCVCSDGTCVNSTAGFKCLCPRGTSGDRCQNPYI